MKNIFVIEEIFMKIMKILDHGNLELYGILISFVVSPCPVIIIWLQKFMFMYLLTVITVGVSY